MGPVIKASVPSSWVRDGSWPKEELSLLWVREAELLQVLHVLLCRGKVQPQQIWLGLEAGTEICCCISNMDRGAKAAKRCEGRRGEQQLKLLRRKSKDSSISAVSILIKSLNFLNILLFFSLQMSQCFTFVRDDELDRQVLPRFLHLHLKKLSEDTEWSSRKQTLLFSVSSHRCLKQKKVPLNNTKTSTPAKANRRL